ncbi:MAG: hypothetical protein JNJ86_04760 [Chitinophagaceae bacterium]|jgi:LPXTG-motif cell wall-anchored protein|nr:hypothetical protein [Chitinophagaceae bacterium]
MIQPTINRIFIVFSLLSLSVFLNAQTGITVKATASKNKILIGEHFELKLEADIPENEPIQFFSIDSLAHFDLIEKQKIDTTNTSNGTVLSQTIRITSFDSGHWVIPAFVLAEGIVTDSIPVDVGYSPFNPEQEYHDIKDVIDVTVEEKTPWWWYAAGGATLLLIIAFIYFLRKKQKPVESKPAVIIDPFAEAMKKLEQLKLNKPEAKQYYSTLVDIFREYIGVKKGIHSAKETTDELILQLKDTGLDKTQSDKLAQTLRLSDFVKFAKYKPAVTDDEEAFKTIRDSIMVLQKTETTILPQGKN